MPAFPSLNEIIDAAKAFVDEFNPKKFFYLSKEGAWAENPERLRDLISHEFFFHLKKTDESEQTSILKELFEPWLEDETWAPAKKLALSLFTKIHPFFILFENILFLTELEILRQQSETPCFDWDREGKTWKKSCARGLEERMAFLENLFSRPEKDLLLSLGQRIAFSPFLSALISFLGEEERLSASIDKLLERARDPKQEGEIYSLIMEKLTPPMGIVTHTSPALLRPCLKLLREKSLPFSSGIQYIASVILSILSDARSSDTLLEALHSCPVYLSKIRENLIYTLGTLGEERAVEPLAQILSLPDEAFLLDQKEECLWALGKIGLTSRKALPVLSGYVDHPYPKLRTYLAWAFGEIGRAQKERLGGVDADVVIGLLKLLKTRDKQVFEESASGLRKIGLPEFLHSLYLSNAGAVNILNLKPAKIGLNELSETFHYLLHSQKRVIVAVNGDSGTGKTYFCHSIKDGFGDFRAEDILYLMRDRPRDQKIFNRILGLRWLKRYIDPVYYHDYPLSEDEDDPEGYLEKFLEENAHKKLILLDGCRDEHYFQRVVDIFYQRGKLDVEANFRATFSTRRLNLEEREVALESVKSHLAFYEEPALEDTRFYQEGVVILYDLDNSILSRLNRQEIQEVFQKSRVDSWGDLIRLGDFGRETQSAAAEEEEFFCGEEEFSWEKESLELGKGQAFSPEEEMVKVLINEDLRSEPYLIKAVETAGIRSRNIHFYAQDQIAGWGEDGIIFVLSLQHNRLFKTKIEHARAIVLLGRDVFVAQKNGLLSRVSFERNEIRSLGRPDSEICSLASLPNDILITGHENGEIRVWNMREHFFLILQAGKGPVTSLAADYGGRIYAADAGGLLQVFDLKKGKVQSLKLAEISLHLLRLYPGGKILIGAEAKDRNPLLLLLDGEKKRAKKMTLPFRQNLLSLSVYFDGRIIVGLSPKKEEMSPGKGTLAILRPGEKAMGYTFLSGHQNGTADCLTMGPRIVSCGEDAPGHYSLRVWGTEFYVRRELSKLLIKGMIKGTFLPF